LSKQFGATAVLKNISFDVAAGEFCVLLGPSGCGKSTLLRLIAGLEKPSAGEVSIDHQRIDYLPPQKRDIAFVFQSYALYPHMTVFENLAFSLRLRGMPADEISAKVKDAAQLLEIDKLLDRRPQSLSGGQRQRVALGRAIVRRPKIFLFDEPLSNLDAALRAGMRVELARLHRRLGTTIIYVTHDQAEALTLGEKIIVLDHGSIQQIGPASEIYHKPANLMVARFVGSPQMNLLEGVLDDDGATLNCGSLRLNLASLLKQTLPRSAGRVLTVGVRAEDFELSGDTAQSWIRGKIDLIEDLGSDRFIHLKCGDFELVARAGREIDLRPSQGIGLNAVSERLHFFQDGRRIEP
jgi:ABC-type sugar transport system ATPase subunit